MVSLPFPMGSSRLATLGALSASSIGTAVAAHASANTKGAWVEFSASTPFAAAGFYLLWSLPGTASSRLVDVGIGAAGSEVVVLSNLIVAGGAGFQREAIFIPLEIPSGARLAVRQQSSTGGQNSELVIVLVAKSFHGPGGFHRAVTYGANPGDSGGVQVDPGGTINAKGAYSEIAGATTGPTHGMLFLTGTQGNALMTSGAWLCDIAIGAAGSEKIVVADLFLLVDSGPDFMVPGAIFFPVTIPEGSRIAVRAQSNFNDATDRVFDTVIIAFG